MSYREDIVQLVDRHITQRGVDGSLAPLLARMGCRHLRWDAPTRKWTASVSPEPAASTSKGQVLTQATLLRALASHLSFVLAGTKADELRDDGYALLDGFSTGDRWRTCLTPTDSAYNLVMLLVLCSADEPRHMATYNSPMWILYRSIRPCIYAIINAWLQPEPAYNAIPSVEALVQSFFGKPWCAIFLNDSAKAIDVITAIEATRPAFINGLLPAHPVEQEATPLPDIGA